MFPFPLLDCHAHIDPTVTSVQILQLKGAHVFAMTRSLEESAKALSNPQPGLVWGIGAHPGVPSSLDNWSEREFISQASLTPLVGEIGMDRRGSSDKQRYVLESALAIDEPTLFSVHSTGRTKDVVEVIERANRPGVILHWFTGNQDEVERAAKAGCYFSINAAMTEVQMRALPLERVLPETDFPSSRSKTGASVPGDIRSLEKVVARLTQTPAETVRSRWYANLGAAISVAGVASRLPTSLLEATEAAK